MTGRNLTNLPVGWAAAPLAEIASINPRLDKTEINDELEVSFIPMASVEAATGRIDLREIRQLRNVKKGYTPFQEGDILFAKITPCMENGKIAVVPALKNGIGFGSTEFHVLRPCRGIDALYIYYFLSTQRFRHDAERNMAGAVGQQRVPTRYLAKHIIPVPPAREQSRIVTKIEEFLSKFEYGVKCLEAAQVQLKVYRQAILNSAFLGELTSHWRKQNGDKLHNADRLIARIADERDALYEAQLARWTSALSGWENSGRRGKRPVKPKRQRDVRPLDQGTLSELPKLPVNWTWIKLGQLTWSVKDGPHYSPKYADQGIPFISGGNVRPDGVDFSTAKFISKELHDELCERCRPEIGDILYTKGGTTGIARVNTYEIEFNVWVHVAILKITKSIEPFFLQHGLNAPFSYVQAQRFTHGVGNQDLGLTRLVNIILPFCGTEEQRAVVSEVERLTSEIDYLENIIDTELRKAESLRQSVLKKAFEGKLVSQEPSDEPASVLLERIKRAMPVTENGKRKTARKDAA
jgi:type I restriction enzyme S subunit